MLKLKGDTYATLLEYAKENQIPLTTLVSKTMDNLAMNLKNKSIKGEMNEQTGEQKP